MSRYVTNHSQNHYVSNYDPVSHNYDTGITVIILFER